jgi:hypothetical protein
MRPRCGPGVVSGKAPERNASRSWARIGHRSETIDGSTAPLEGLRLLVADAPRPFLLDVQSGTVRPLSGLPARDERGVASLPWATTRSSSRIRSAAGVPRRRACTWCGAGAWRRRRSGRPSLPYRPVMVAARGCSGGTGTAARSRARRSTVARPEPRARSTAGPGSWRNSPPGSWSRSPAARVWTGTPSSCGRTARGSDGAARSCSP